jgi:hypothetical protein
VRQDLRGIVATRLPARYMRRAVVFIPKACKADAEFSFIDEPKVAPASPMRRRRAYAPIRL